MADIVSTARQNATQANSHAAAPSASASESTSSAQPSVVHSLIKCAVYHRLGVVPVGESSIVIAVSSPHRKAAFIACEQILEDVKDRAQIWKREFYEGEPDSTAEWKANH
jgi:molybdopterin synthase catalytic subunit